MLRIFIILIFSCLLGCKQVNYTTNKEFFSYAAMWGIKPETDTQLYALFPANQCTKCFTIHNTNPALTHQVTIIHALNKEMFSGFQSMYYDSTNTLQTLQLVNYANTFVVVKNKNIVAISPITDFFPQADSLLAVYP
ncbi:MAG: hypothetical protein V4538_11695 [Bacteroidota bacterium]